MGWAAADGHVKEEVKVELSKTKMQVSALKAKIAQIQHTEKREALLDQVTSLWIILDTVEKLLYR